jgi:hypothetical protein
VRGVEPQLSMYPRRFNELRELLSGCGPPALTFTLGTDGGAMSPGVDSDVNPLSFRLCVQVTKSRSVRAGPRR